MITIIRKEDSAILEVDGVISEDYSPQMQSSDHTIEQGSEVTDNIRSLPEVFTISAKITETPFDPAGDKVGGIQRIQDVLQFLRQSKRKIVDVVTTRNGTYKNCAILEFPHTFTKDRSLQITLTIKQMEFARATSVIISPQTPKPEVKAGIVDEKDAGQQPMNEIVATPEERQKSTVFQYTGNIFRGG